MAAQAALACWLGPVLGCDGLDFGLRPVLVLAHAAEAVGHASVAVSSNAEVV